MGIKNLFKRLFKRSKEKKIKPEDLPPKKKGGESDDLPDYLIRIRLRKLQKEQKRKRDEAKRLKKLKD